MSLIKYQSSNLRRLKIYAYNCVPQNLEYTFYKSYDKLKVGESSGLEYLTKVNN